ncbi:hypothetical protein ElyMa_006900700 [Elysia marginata]|uniref:Uncharacterized protein n=1 Tax=Elysia marginata TaxID=1093978 RepID=A0AAV4JCG8_9GAST|nr:hypothetical protein ElyMa_006900700 [Elysia marginata]
MGTITAFAFRHWKSGMSQYLLNKLEKRPYLDKIICVRFTRGSQKLEYKNDFSDDFKEVEFQRSTFELQEEPQKPIPRGFLPQKKQDIIKTLLSLMPGTRHAF